MPNRYWKMFQAGFSEQEQNKQKQMHKYKEKTDDCHRGGGWGDGQKEWKGSGRYRPLVIEWINHGDEG